MLIAEHSPTLSLDQLNEMPSDFKKSLVPSLPSFTWTIISYFCDEFFFKLFIVDFKYLRLLSYHKFKQV